MEIEKTNVQVSKDFHAAIKSFVEAYPGTKMWMVFENCAKSPKFLKLFKDHLKKIEGENDG